jgi:hypothetical protein
MEEWRRDPRAPMKWKASPAPASRYKRASSRVSPASWMHKMQSTDMPRNTEAKSKTKSPKPKSAQQKLQEDYYNLSASDHTIQSG